MSLGTLDVFHLGVVVEDLDASMRVLSDTLGLTWAPVQELSQTVRTGGGAVLCDRIRFTYSVEGAPHLELVDSEEQRVWRPAPGQLHHIGVFAEDLAGESARLAARGVPLELGGGARETPLAFAYHLSPGGVRIELVDAARRPDFARWIAGGRLTAG